MEQGIFQAVVYGSSSFKFSSFRLSIIIFRISMNSLIQFFLFSLYKCGISLWQFVYEALYCEGWILDKRKKAL